MFCTVIHTMRCHCIKPFSELLTTARLQRLKAFGLTPAHAKDLLFHTNASTDFPKNGIVTHAIGENVSAESGNVAVATAGAETASLFGPGALSASVVVGIVSVFIGLSFMWRGQKTKRASAATPTATANVARQDAAEMSDPERSDKQNSANSFERFEFSDALSDDDFALMGKFDDEVNETSLDRSWVPPNDILRQSGTAEYELKLNRRLNVLKQPDEKLSDPIAIANDSRRPRL